MAELPLIMLPAPESRPREGKSRFVPDSVRPRGAGTRMARLDGKFGRIPDISSDPELLAELRSNPEAIVPERALVFEVATSKQDLHKALERVPELNFLGEEEREADEDEDFYTVDNDGNRTEKSVPHRIFFTLPSIAALNQLKKLWEVYKSGERLTRPHTIWNEVFEHLSDVRAWGPQDRLSEQTRDRWNDQLFVEPTKPIRMQAELWFRETDEARGNAYEKLEQAVSQLKSGGQIIGRVTIPEIRYDSTLLEMSPRSVRDILDSPNVDLVTLDDVMTLKVESMVRTPYDDDYGDGDGDDDVEGASPDDGTKYQVTPIAALIDGAPISQHVWLKDRLIVDDPDNFLQRYRTVTEQIHGTSMASIILHGDLNSPTPLGRSARRLYVRPVMQPYETLHGSVEAMPSERSVIDLTHKAFTRMFDGDEEGDAVAPQVRVVNVSLGDTTTPFESNMSPWARLIDHLAWKYRVLIIVSAGNREENMNVQDIDTYDELSSRSPSDREAAVIKSVLQHRAARRLLSPSESLNCLTVGAAHSDMLESRHSGDWVVDPYENSKLPNPSSAQGFGYKKSVKPEILMPGGREHIEAAQTHSPVVIRPSSSSRLCGIGSAAPGEVGNLSNVRNYCGTSVATALATHGTLHILAALEDLQLAALNGRQMNDYIDVLLKALLVHSARWDKRASERIQEVSRELGVRHWEHRRHDATRLLGFGSADISRVIDCTKERATLIGWNSIGDKNVDTFRIPIPNGLENLAGFRAVTATVAWSTPLNMRHRAYRAAKLAVDDGSDKELSLGVKNAGHQPSHNVFGAGTIFHRRWEGDRAKKFVDNGDIVLDVSCTSPTQDLDEFVRYGIAVSLEVGEDVGVSVYDEVSELVRQRTAARAVS